uniref:FtsW/RodA/SpoVE family cell cycle protein n=1 Tax=Alistipes sp. Marseille-P5061 TaxID=2048242 RepID=UPI001F2E0F9F|nr:FtsW/RodA/SpoVE family cell cycle protein [Alistipes sp. Marseille-P5061]
MERTTMNNDDTTPRSGAAGDDGAQAASERARRTRAERSAGGRAGGSGDAGSAGGSGSSSGAGSGAGAAAAADGGAAGGRGLHLGRLFNGDRVLWIIIAALAVISILVVYSSTAKMAYDAHTARTTYHFLRQQVMVLILSLGAMIAVQKIDSRVYRALAKPAYILSVLLTLLAYFIGRTTNGAARWIPLGFFDLQPSEALKVATVLFLARQLGSRQSRIDKIRIVPSLKFWTWRRSREQRRIWREGTWPILMPVAVSALVIFPAHTSSAVLVCMASWVMMLIGRVNFRELMKLVWLGVAAVLLVWMLNLGRSETAEGRVGTWLHLWTTTQTEKPIEHLTDTERSMIAIHNGGLLGEGAGQSAMRVEMIHPESDYAYAFFVEEYGIVLAVVLLMLYLWIFFRAIEIFRRCGTAFPGLMVLGLALLITCQALLHVMVTVNLIPETGQTLPLISRGGSSVLFTTIALGMILSVSRQNDEQSHDRPRGETMYEK